MFLIVIAFIALVTGFVLQSNERTKTASIIAKVVGVVMLLVGLASSCIVQIEAGQVGVPTLFGKVSGRILNSGLNFVNPFVVVKKFDIRTQNYTMAGQYDEGDRQGEDAMRVLTSDGLELMLDVSVLYRVVPTEAPKILSTIGENYEDVIVRPIARTKIRDNATSYTAIDLYSIKREEYQQKVFSNIEKEFRARGMELEQLLVRNITLPESVKTSIESKIQAEQDAQKMEFVLQKETQEAERKRVEAQGISDYQRIVSQTLNANQLQYEMIKAYKELALSGNGKVIIMGDTKGGVPIILSDK
ncbi:MAG: prohibitin family protein [Chitinophagales bacterium]|jgi:regulator of protease activity HflC (stomatin/prohibitin superfamily)|nr:prohibitin family protein [Chitinophagaceae bacterium]MBP9881991.1 prohibitin family protein [Chitinophagales bacterium]